MARDDDEPLPKRIRRLEPLRLDALGVDELGLYIEELRHEIERVQADIGRKQSHRAAADSFFRKPG